MRSSTNFVRLCDEVYSHQHSISILHQIATFAGGIYFAWICHFQLSDFSQAVILHLSVIIRVLIGFCHISRSHLNGLTFVHSLVLLPALHFYPPPDRNFCWREIFQLDLSFSAFIFLTSRNFGFVNRLDFTKFHKIYWSCRTMVT